MVRQGLRKHPEASHTPRSHPRYLCALSLSGVVSLMPSFHYLFRGALALGLSPALKKGGARAGGTPRARAGRELERDQEREHALRGKKWG
eukprot:2275116-Rhodomonas_salina.3